MSIQECIKNRRSIRKFLPVPVEGEKLGKILDAARYAPSAGNLQNWKFILITEQTKKRAVIDACMQQYWMETAPLLIVVCGDPIKGDRFYGTRGKTLYTIQNCAAAIQNMLLAAHSQGIGSCWVGAFDTIALKKALSIPDTVEPQAVLCFGYADETVPLPPRYTIENVVYLERYGNRIKDIAAFMNEYSIHVQKALATIKTYLGKKLAAVKATSPLLQQK